MNCEQVMREEIVEKYLLGKLGDADLEAFERHYFSCDQCFDRLESLREAQDQLARDRLLVSARPRPAHWPWWTAAAAAAAAALLIVLLTMTVPTSERTELARAEPAATRPAPPAVARAPTTPPAAVPERGREPLTESGTRELRLAELARVGPAPYEPVVLRGPAGEARLAFRTAMEHYREGDYAAAAEGLRAALELDPEVAVAAFYLGVSELLAGDPETAILALRRVLASGAAGLEEEARFYLAHAHLARGDAESAETELEAVVRIGQARAEAAARTLAELRRLPPAEASQR